MRLPPRSAACAASTTRSSRPLAARGRSVSVGPVLGDEQAGEGEQVELGQVGRLVVGGDVVLARPVPRVGQPALGDADPRPRRPGWVARPGRSRAGTAARPRSSMPRRAVEVAAGPQQPGHGGVPAVPVLQQRRAVAELPGGLEVLAAASRSPCSRSTSARPTCRSPVVDSDRSLRPFGGCQRPLVQPSRLVGPAAGQPHAGQDDGRAELVGDVAGRVQAARPPRRTCPRRCRGRRRPRRPGRGTRPRRRGPDGRPARPARSARRACATVPSTSPRAWATEAR